MALTEPATIDTPLAKAKRIVEEELRRLGWEEAELRRRPKGDRAKVRIARRVGRRPDMADACLALILPD